MNYEIKSYRTDHGTKTVMTGPPGRKLMPILVMESSGLTVKKVPLSEQRYMSSPIQNGKAKALSTSIKNFRAFGRQVGMTKAAKSFLTSASKAA